MSFGFIYCYIYWNCLTANCYCISWAIDFKANEVIPIGGMLANNGLIAINLAYQNLDRAFVKDITDIESKLTLAAT